MATKLLSALDMCTHTCHKTDFDTSAKQAKELSLISATPANEKKAEVWA